MLYDNCEKLHMGISEKAEMRALITNIGVGFIAIGTVITIFVLLAAEPARKVMPLCVNTFSQLCSYLGGTMTVVYMVIFGLIMPLTGMLLIVSDFKPASRRYSIFAPANRRLRL